MPKLKRARLVCTGAFHTDGGIAALNRLVIHTLEEEGYDLDIFCLTETEAPFDDYSEYNSRDSYRTFAGNKLRFTASVWQSILRAKCDWTFVDHINLAAMLAPAGAMGICQYIVWLCGLEVFPPRPDREGRLGLKHAWKRLAISTYTRTSVVRRFPRLAIGVVDLALDPLRHAVSLPAEPPQIRSPLCLEAIDGVNRCLGPKAVLHVGRMARGERFKGQESLLRAIPAIYQEFPDVQLVFAGQGDDMPRLRAIAEAYHPSIQGRIFMPGYVDNALLDQLYQACYMFAMPSIGEGFGLVYLEAMSRAKPCVGGLADATPCVVRDGVTGLLVDDPRSPSQVAERINWLFDNPMQARAMGRAGYDLVRSYYLLPHFKERFWKAIAA